MSPTTFKRTTEIHASVREVFSFVSNPVALFGAWPMAVAISDVTITREGVGTTYHWSGGGEWGHSLSGTITRQVHVADQSMVERSTSGTVWRWSFAADGTGTKLTVEVDHTSRSIGGVDPNVLRMTGRDTEELLARIKERIERR